MRSGGLVARVTPAAPPAPPAARSLAGDHSDEGVQPAGQGRRCRRSAPRRPAGARLAAAGRLRRLLLPAAGVLLVGYTDNVLTGRAFAIRGGYEIDANQEFLALGAANVGAEIFRGMPVSSSGSRTAIGESAGSRTQLHSLVVVACIIVVLLFLRPVLAVFPVAALGAIVIYAATRLVDLAEFRRLARYRRSELVLSLVTLVSVLVFDI